MAAETGPVGADEPPLVVSYRTVDCDGPPCLPIRNASRPPDFRGTFRLYQHVVMCLQSCGRRPYGSFQISAEGFAKSAKTVVLHGERRKHDTPHYYTHRVRAGEIPGTVTLEGDCWFDEKSGRLEILVRAGVPRKWESRMVDK
ncbi:hypothetical protein [Chelatococcus sp.]|nr:hypothetical protein [Chelatococcus sp.]MBX3557765.1 hypothetical protein [Chelatococcus sp.]